MAAAGGSWKGGSFKTRREVRKVRLGPKLAPAELQRQTSERQRYLKENERASRQEADRLWRERSKVVVLYPHESAAVRALYPTRSFEG